MDVAFWRSTRLFQTLTGPAMDYYTPLKQRKMSFKEFMLEWIVNHHERILEDYGLKKPWYWDQFLLALENGHHAMHLGTWFWRPTLFWKPNAGVSKAERKWLNEKYPTWEENWGSPVGRDHRQRQRRPSRAHAARDAARAVQPDPAAAGLRDVTARAGSRPPASTTDASTTSTPRSPSGALTSSPSATPGT